MSGTSLDGIDIALCSICENKIETLSAKEYSYDTNIKEEVLNAIANKVSLETIGTLHHRLALMYIKALEEFLSEFQIDSKDILEQLVCMVKPFGTLLTLLSPFQCN